MGGWARARAKKRIGAVRRDARWRGGGISWRVDRGGGSSRSKTSCVGVVANVWTATFWCSAGAVCGNPRRPLRHRVTIARSFAASRSCGSARGSSSSSRGARAGARAVPETSAQMPRRTIAKTTRTTKSTPPRRRTRRMTTTRAPPPPTRAPHPPTRVPPPPPTRTLPTSRFSVSAPRPPRARLRAFVPPRTPSPSPRARSPSACRASKDTATACSAPSPAGSTLGSEREVPSDPQPPPRGSSRAHSPAVARATSRGPTFARFSSEDSATSSATPPRRRQRPLRRRRKRRLKKCAVDSSVARARRR